MPTFPFTPMPTFIHPLETMKELYRTNGGCQLPCWWGIHPGLTTWPQVRQLLDRFGERYVYIGDFDPYYPRPGITGRYTVSLSQIPPSDDGLMANFDLGEDIIQIITLEEGIIKLARWTPRYMLSAFGAPEVLVAPSGILLMYFESYGIVAHFTLEPFSPKSPYTDCLSYFNNLTLYGPAYRPTQDRLRFDLASLIGLPASTLQSVDPDSLLDQFHSQSADLCITLQ